MTTATRDRIESDLSRVLGWEVAIHEPHGNFAGREDVVALGEQWDRGGNTGFLVGHFALDRLAEILPTLPDYDPSLISDETGEQYADTSAAWRAIDAAKLD